MGRLDEDGSFFHRRPQGDDLRGGFNIRSREIEEVLHEPRSREGRVDRAMAFAISRA
jgi:hypothetical protein